ncbi:MAG: TlpA family protein disulfide reductase [Saprospiraceae bacterium]|jgi:thiol-disulfide isomerase/thioredoxin|nr:TlpA family protein disulfide reductase [Saprospiraceae bacterium]
MSYLKSSILLAILFVTSVISCQQLGGKHLISGEISGAENLTVFLDQIQPDGSSKVLQKGTVSTEGTFDLESEEPFGQGIYRLRIGEKVIFFALEGDERQLKINGPLATMDKFMVEASGSAVAEEYISTLKNLINNTSGSEADTKAAVEGVKHPLVAMHMAQMIFRNDPTYLAMHQNIFKRMNKAYPDSPYTKQYAIYVAKVEKTESRVLTAGPVKVGDPAPDIVLPGPDGTIYKLSDLKGKVVLLDFWASWCGPCRMENPNVVAIYNKYKEKGFTVFSVSLDGMDERTLAKLGGDQKLIEERKERTKQQWVQAIEKDNLTWKYHVSDLKKWDAEPARTYGVSSIPKTFLIDKEGKIAVIETRGILEAELLKLL